MYPWHQETIERIRELVADDPRYVALVVVGSVARGDPRKDSDIDAVLVATDSEYARRRTAHDLLIDWTHLAVSPCHEAGAYVCDMAYLDDAVDLADEESRYQFVDGLVAFSRIPDLESTLRAIAGYPEAQREEKMISFAAQVPLHFSYLELAKYSQNAYLLAETAVELVRYGGRLILAYNRMLCPNRKWFMRELARAPERPVELVDLAQALLREPSIAHGKAFMASVLGFRDWPEAPGGQWQRIGEDIVWNWRTGRPPPRDW